MTETRFWPVDVCTQQSLATELTWKFILPIIGRKVHVFRNCVHEPIIGEFEHFWHPVLSNEFTESSNLLLARVTSQSV